MSNTTTTTNTQERERESIREHARASGEELKHRADETLAAAGERVGELYEQGRETVAKHVDTLETSVKKEPLKSVAIAAGIGFFAGLLLNRR